jgi:hypothetical protein
MADHDYPEHDAVVTAFFEREGWTVTGRPARPGERYVWRDERSQPMRALWIAAELLARWSATELADVLETRHVGDVIRANPHVHVWLSPDVDGYVKLRAKPG